MRERTNASCGLGMVVMGFVLLWGACYCGGPVEASSSTPIRRIGQTGNDLFGFPFTCDELTLSADGLTMVIVCTQNDPSNTFVGVDLYKATFDLTAIPPDWSVASQPITTPTAGIINGHPRLTGDGSLLTYQASNVSGADQSADTFVKALKDQVLDTALLDPLTGDETYAAGPVPAPNPTSRASHAVVSQSGALIVFSSSLDLVPTNNPDGTPAGNADGNPEIFVYDLSAYDTVEPDPATIVLHQVTNTAAPVKNLHPVIGSGDDGQLKGRIAYLSDTRGPGNFEVYTADFLADPVEENPTNQNCHDDVDNDFDFGKPGGGVDCTDPGCATDTFCISKPKEICTPGTGDEDGDGLTNCADPDCNADPVCQPGPPSLTVIPDETSATVLTNGSRQWTVEVSDADGDSVTVQVSGANLSLPPCGDAEKAAGSCSCVEPPAAVQPMRSAPLLRPLGGLSLRTPLNVTPVTGQCFYDVTELPLSATVTFNAPATPTLTEIVITAVDDNPATTAGTERRIMITVEAPPQPPQQPPVPFGSLGDMRLKLGKTYGPIQVGFTDPNPGDTLTLTVHPPLPEVTLTGNGSVTHTITWTPPLGVHDLRVTGSDGIATVELTGRLEVVDNQEPRARVNSPTIEEGTAYSASFNAGDPDGDPLVWSVISTTRTDGGSPQVLSTPLPPGAVFKHLIGQFNWLPWFDQAGTYDIRFGLSDCTGGLVPPACVATPVEVVMTITVTDFPADQAYAVDRGGNVTVPANAMVPLSVRVINAGTNTWTAQSGYALAPYYRTYGMPEPAAVKVLSGESIEMNETKTFNVNVQAPSSPGDYYINFRMMKNGQYFGSLTAYSKITVK